MFDVLIFIGRFQPFHVGHEAIVKKALETSKQVIILCGSANQARSLRNPWSVEEREYMIRGCFSDKDNEKMFFTSTPDAHSDEIWVRSTMAAIKSVLSEADLSLKIGIIGHLKDESSYYLTLFPEYESFYMESQGDISATPIRHALFTPPFSYAPYASYLPESVQSFLNKFMNTSDFLALCREVAIK